MNTSALKTFAPAVRRQLIEAVTRKFDYLITATTPDTLTTFRSRIEVLRKLSAKERAALIESTAYTWFNRLAALRYLDAKGWHPFRARVLTAATAEETQPEVLRLMRTGALPENLQRHTDLKRLNDLLDGNIPSTDPQGEVYRHLVLAACRFYHALLPTLFERLDDETELLLPDDLLTEHSVVQGFRAEISDDDCAEVELLGWLYQFYIAEKKDAVMARKSAVPTEDIPAVTQLFTPHWIVRYLVENSLGRLWLLNRPNSRLREQMPYYIEGEAETDFLVINKPEDIRLLDPAVGSGHMLTYAFDLLAAIYEEEGYAPSDIPALILTHNLHGLDICPRAAQLASLALVLKARERDRRFFHSSRLVQPHILALQDVRFDEDELHDYVRALRLGTLFDGPVMQLLRQFEQATTFGSLIQPILGEADIAELRRAIADKDPGSNLFLSETHGKVLRVLEQAEMLTQRYQVVVANPPYMGSGGMNPNLLEFVRRTFANASTDLYSVFTIRNLSLVKAQGLVGMITIPNWMFLASFEDFRRFLLQHVRVESLVHNGRGVWGSDFGSCSFILSNCPANNQAGSYRKLFNRQGEVQSNDEIESNFFNLEKFPLYKRVKTDFEKIPGWPLGFWLNSTEYEAFKDGVSLTEMSTPVVGLQTGDNERFIRNWNEVSFRKIGFGFRTSQEALLSKAKWFPYTKGGTFRKWYGNNSFIIDWENDGYVIRNHPSSRPQNRNYYFRSGLAYTNVSSASFAARFTDSGFIFDQKGSMFFSANNNHSVFTLGLLHTKIVTRLLTVLCPTVDFNPGSLAKIPVISFATIGHKVQSIITELINLARIDWDNFETSWDFRKLPLLRPELKAETLAASWQNWQAHCDAAIRRMQELERENNRLFIEAYGLQDELTPEVPEDQITLARADARKDVAAFLSYAVGCMMGRYALDQPGLILANAGDTLEHFRLRMAESGLRMEALRFLPDEDGIIPVLDGEWFEDDIVARTREFLRVTFGEATLRDNLRWLEEALGKDLRKYFLVDFYKNHLSNERAYGYKKRPIYWLVQSPQKGFSALIYLHRYTRDTLNLVLNRYLRPYQDKLRARLSDLTRVQASTEASTADKTKARKEADKLTKVLRECEEWERQTLLPLAQQRIELDLDDGVKVNYQKLGEALAPIPGLAAKEED